MKLIAHRGNTSGPNKERENSPDYIIEAVNKGFYVEVDVWYVENELYLGHDTPVYPTTISFLKNPKFYVHAKNIAALEQCIEHNINCFSHNIDEAVLTSNNEIWTFPGKSLTRKSICVMPEWQHGPQTDWSFLGDILGVCTDYCI